VIDATCPLVTKVHLEALRMEKDGYTIVLIAHRGHTEVEGTMGHVPSSIVLVQNAAEVADLVVSDPERVAYLTQTTLSLDDVRRDGGGAQGPLPQAPFAVVRQHLLRHAEPAERGEGGGAADRPPAGGRFEAEQQLQPAARGRRIRGVRSFLIDNAEEIQPEWLVDARRIGVHGRRLHARVPRRGGAVADSAPRGGR
jgi:4-hydroxy-3-methylbut-2-enyl diphosphate reductase